MSRSLASVLQSRGESARADEPAIRFYDEGAWTTWSWRDYWRAARAAASAMRSVGVAPGDRVLLLTPEVKPSTTLILGLWTLGAVPIQVGLPYRLNDVAGFAVELRGLAEKLDAKALVVSAKLAAFASSSSGSAIPIFAAEALLAQGDPDDTLIPDPDAAPDPALIQLTSGSTGHPRGVMIPHERLMRHMQSMSAALPTPAHAVGVSWLPLHHDMGLIGGLLFPLYNGFVDHMLSPLDFRRDPMLWMKTISERRATISPAPPSAFALAAKLGKLAGALELDLSSWECAMIGAEPIPPELLRRFSDAYAGCGFRPEAFFPVYGLAEATVAVTFPKLLGGVRFDRVSRRAIERDKMAALAAPGDPDVLELVGCGSPIPGTELRIAGEKGETLGERQVGQIAFRSDSAMSGYFRDEAATLAVTVDGWMRTGDLGYVAGGDLFITGREKELIINGGHNVLPWAIEEVAGGVEGVRKGCVAAVGVRDERIATERIVVVVETKLDQAQYDRLIELVRDALGARGISVDRVVPVSPGTLPKTTSGKLRRREVAQALSAGLLS